MNPNVNKHGLSRNIPEPIKREIRQKCGFGCVICGLGLYQYEHVVPEFSDATEHNADHMCLLCPNHHSRVTTGLLSKDDVRSAMNSPAALKRGFSHDDEFSLFRRPITALLGRVEFINPSILIQYAEEKLIWFEEHDGRLLFNGKFYDRDNQLILEIINNEWRPSSGNWDVEQSGKKLKIRESSGVISLTVNCVSAHEIHFDYVNMYVGGNRFKSRKNQLINIETRSGAGFFDSQEFKTAGPLVFRDDGGFEVRGGMMMRGGMIRGSRLQ